MTKQIHYLVCMTACFFMIACSSEKQNKNLALMPSVDRVSSTMTGQDSIDTYYKQAGAFVQLIRIVKASDAEPYNLPSKDEEKIIQQYTAAHNDRQNKGNRLLQEKRNTVVKKPKHQHTAPNTIMWDTLYRTYSTERSFRLKLYELYFPKRYSQQYDQYFDATLAFSDWKQHSAWRGIFRDVLPIVVYVCVIILSFILFKRTVRKSSMPLRLTENDPFLVSSGHLQHRLRSFSGYVSFSETFIDTQFQVYGNQYGIRTDTQKSEHNRFMLVDRTGEERAVELIDTGIRVRPGNRVSAVWAIKRGEDRGQYLFFFNHDTKTPTIFRDAIKRMVLADHISSLFLACFIFAITGFAFELLFRYAHIEFGFAAVVIQLISSLLAFIVNSVVISSARDKSTDQFIRVEMNQLIQQLEQEMF